jgi:hypothetical protein
VSDIDPWMREWVLDKGEGRSEELAEEEKFK